MNAPDRDQLREPYAGAEYGSLRLAFNIGPQKSQTYMASDCCYVVRWKLVKYKERELQWHRSVAYKLYRKTERTVPHRHHFRCGHLMPNIPEVKFSISSHGHKCSIFSDALVLCLYATGRKFAATLQIISSTDCTRLACHENNRPIKY